MKRAILKPDGSMKIISITDEEISEHDALISEAAAHEKSVDWRAYVFECKWRIARWVRSPIASLSQRSNPLSKPPRRT